MPGPSAAGTQPVQIASAAKNSAQPQRLANSFSSRRLVAGTASGPVASRHTALPGGPKHAFRPDASHHPSQSSPAPALTTPMIPPHSLEPRPPSAALRPSSSSGHKQITRRVIEHAAQAEAVRSPQLLHRQVTSTAQLDAVRARPLHGQASPQSAQSSISQHRLPIAARHQPPLLSNVGPYEARPSTLGALPTALASRPVSKFMYTDDATAPPSPRTQPTLPSGLIKPRLTSGLQPALTDTIVPPEVAEHIAQPPTPHITGQPSSAHSRLPVKKKKKRSPHSATLTVLQDPGTKVHPMVLSTLLTDY